MSNKDTFNKAYPIPGFVLFLIAVIVPAAFAVAGGFPSFVKTFSDIRILRQLSYSLILALCCTVSAVITGLPFAYITASYSFRARGFFRKLNALFFVFPPVLTILCFEILFGEKGFFPFNIPYPFLKHGLLLTVFNIPVIVLLVSSWWSRLDYRLETTALSLGLKPSAVFFDITLPRLRPAITGSAALVFLRCFSDIAIVNFYAKGSKFINAGSLMYRLKENGNPETAGSLSIFVTLISLFFLVIFCSSFTKLKGSILTRDENRKPLKKPKSFGSRLLVFIFIILNLAFLLAPAAAVVFKSFYYGGQFYAGAYTNLFSSFKVWGTGTFLNSLLIAFAAALISTFIALRISSASLYMNFYACLALLPLAFGSATLGLGYYRISEILPSIPGLVYAISAHCAAVLPAAVLIIFVSYLGINGNLKDSARSLGFGAKASFGSIDRRLLSRAVTASFLITFAISLGEYGSSAFLGTDTISMQINALIISGEMNTACALGSILSVLCVVVFLIGAKLLKREK